MSATGHGGVVETEHVHAFERRQSTGASTRRLMERDEWQEEFAAAFVGLLPPSAVIIEGEPGLGRTALLNAACHLAMEAGHEVLRAGRCARIRSPVWRCSPVAPTGSSQAVAERAKDVDAPVV